MATKPPRSVALLLKRFVDLPEDEQLLAYESLRDYLKAGQRTAPSDPVLDERADALRVMRRVAEHYKLDNGAELAVKQFDAAPESVREGWRSGRVIRAFGTWRAAGSVLAGATPPPTARQRAVRRQAALQRLKTDDYIAGIRDWLATTPPEETDSNYEDWVIEENAKLEPGQLRYAMPLTIRTTLKIGWRDTLRVAKGEIGLDEVRKRQAERRPAFTRGEHDLVSHGDIVAMTGKASSSIHALSHTPTWPTPVLIINGKRHYLREDVEAYFADKPVPKRKRDGLRLLYLNSAEVAALAGLRVAQWEGRFTAKPDQVPAPIAGVAGKRLWLRSEVEAWIKTERERANQAKTAKKLPDKKSARPGKSAKSSR